MNDYETKRTLHRQYLQSTAWKEFRTKALTTYGTICNRCGEYGTDVHHKTYDNWGNERLEDVEVLCRDCHQVEHTIQRTQIKGLRKKKRPRKKSIHVKGALAYMPKGLKKQLMEKYGFETEKAFDLKVTLCREYDELIKEICRKMQIDIYGIKKGNQHLWRKKGRRKRR